MDAAATTREPAGVSPGAPQAPSRRGWLIVTLAALVVGAGLRVGEYARQRSYWHDEAALVLNVFEKPARELVGRLDSAQAAPPLFLLSQRGVYLTLGRSEFAMRLVPLLLALASLALFAALAWRVLPPDGAALAAIMFSLSDRLIWHGTEAKQYSGDVFVALVLLLCAVPRRDAGEARCARLRGKQGAVRRVVRRVVRVVNPQAAGPPALRVLGRSFRRLLAAVAAAGMARRADDATVQLPVRDGRRGAACHRG